MEKNNQTRIQKEVSLLGARVFNNSVGMDMETFVFYGLHRGASDLIGLWRDGRFLSIEVKTKDEYKYARKHYERLKACTKVIRKPVTKDEHLIEQIRWIEMVLKFGGIAFFSYSPKHTRKVLLGYETT